MKRVLATLLAIVALGSGAEPLPATGTVEVMFSPWDDAEGAIVRMLGEAKTTVHVQAYLITSRTIARALQEAHGRGVAVKVLADREMADKGGNSQLRELAAVGIAVWLETRYNAAHNKIILIDAASSSPILITGSYNFTWSAQARNAENLLILKKNPALVLRYLSNWQRHHDSAVHFDSGQVRMNERVSND